MAADCSQCQTLARDDCIENGNDVRGSPRIHTKCLSTRLNDLTSSLRESKDLFLSCWSDED